jgi:2-oxoglutarate ferredoxin oxidoreductase subunit gamma
MMPEQAQTGGPADAAVDEHRLIIAGSGGQGVLSLGKILCISAMGEGKTVTYLPSYGAEVRGGTANCQVTVSSHTIYSPLVEQADSLIIMNQLSYDRFWPGLRNGGLAVLNSSAVTVQAGAGNGRILTVPATERAAEMGSVRVANVIMLGAFLATVPLIEWDSCLRALAELWGDRKADLVELNTRALKVGAGLAR